MSAAIAKKLEKFFRIDAERDFSLRPTAQEDGNYSFSVSLPSGILYDSYRFLLQKHLLLEEAGLINGSRVKYDDEEAAWDLPNDNLIFAIRDDKKHKEKLAENATLEVKPYSLFRILTGRKSETQLHFQIDFGNRSEKDILHKLDEAIRRAELDHTLDENGHAGLRTTFKRENTLHESRRHAEKPTQRNRGSNDEKDIQIVTDFVTKTAQEVIPGTKVAVAFSNERAFANGRRRPGFVIKVHLPSNVTLNENEDFALIPIDEEGEYSKIHKIIDHLNRKLAIKAADPTLRFHMGNDIEITASPARLAAEIEGSMPRISSNRSYQRA